MSRALWFAAGVASGVYGLIKARRALENVTPDGLAARAASWQLGAQLFADEVSSGMAARETELRDDLKLARLEAQNALAARDLPAIDGSTTQGEGSKEHGDR